jgi:hypothetical protein
MSSEALLLEDGNYLLLEDGGLILLDLSISISVMLSAPAMVGFVGNVLVWGEIDNNQNPNWQDINNSQNPNWQDINNSQNPNWVSIAA